MGFVSVGLDSFRKTRANHIVVRISTRGSFSRHAPRVPFGLSSAYNWIYQVKVGTDECHANVRVANDDDTYRSVPLGRRLIPAKRECQTSADIGWLCRGIGNSCAASALRVCLKSVSNIDAPRNTWRFPIIFFFFFIRLYLNIIFLRLSSLCRLE